MLKGIPKILSPELLKVLCEMGHGDRILLADGNFPSESTGENAKVIRCDGHGVPELLDAILRLMPLDRSTEKPVRLMEVSAGEAVETSIWNTYGTILSSHDERGDKIMETMERYAFYEASRSCYAIVVTGESALYANIMLQKGVVI